MLYVEGLMTSAPGVYWTRGRQTYERTAENSRALENKSRAQYGPRTSGRLRPTFHLMEGVTGGKMPKLPPDRVCRGPSLMPAPAGLYGRTCPPAHNLSSCGQLCRSQWHLVQTSNVHGDRGVTEGTLFSFCTISPQYARARALLPHGYYPHNVSLHFGFVDG
jgi:hypothetical protein